jgi:hypothetical protein
LRQCEQKAIRDQVKQSIRALASPLFSTTTQPSAAPPQAPENIILELDTVITTLERLQVAPRSKK